jgi:hypothetical protein
VALGAAIEGPDHLTGDSGEGGITDRAAMKNAHHTNAY